MTGYQVSIREASKELTARERIKFKDVSNAEPLDKVVVYGEVLSIQPESYAILDVHNEKSDNKDYTKYVIEDANGVLYTTGSESFFNTFMNIHEEMEGEPYTLDIFKRESKNYSGKQFLTCSIQ